MSSLNKGKTERQIGKMLFMYAEEAIHVGAGSSTGTIDKPIQREQHTGLPKFEGSGNKGSVREASWDNFVVEFEFEFENDEKTTYAALKEQLNSIKEDDGVKKEIDKKKNVLKEKMKAIEKEFARIYGYKNNGDKHSAIDIPDAQLLFFPVRSWKGVFVWLTSPYVLQKYVRDHNRLFNDKLNISSLEDLDDDNKILTNAGNNFSFGENNDKAILEEYLYEVVEKEIKIGDNLLNDWILNMFGGEAEANDLMKMLKTNIAVVKDDVFVDFTELYTVKITRNKIDSEKGVASGTALFNEEFLPSDSILYTPIIANAEFEDGGKTAGEVMNFVEDNLPNLYKIGGDKNIGKGLLRANLYVPEQINEPKK